MNIVSIICSEEQDCLVFDNDSTTVGDGLRVRFENANKKPSVIKITTLEEFDQSNGDLIDSFLSDDYSQNQVFIMPEGWEEGSVDKGYEMAAALLDSVGKSKTFNLRFVSMFPQDVLLELVEKKYRVLVKTFPHICLLDSKNEEPLNPRAYSSIHFKLIRDIAVSDSGRLAAIRHDVKNVLNNLYDHALSLLDDLESPPFISSFPDCPKRLADLRAQVNDMKKWKKESERKKAARQIQNDFYRLIDEIDACLARPTGEKKAKQAYRVLIIDDEPEQRKELFDFFSRYYTVVACNDIRTTLSPKELEQWERQLEETFPGKSKTKAKEAFIELVESITLQNQKDTSLLSMLPAKLECFDIIVLDLLYKNQNAGTWLPFDGLDLYLGICEQSPYSAVRIITSLPRNEISAILDDEGVKLLIDHVFTKGNGWEQLEGCFLDRMDGINKECEHNAELSKKSKGIRMPRKGFFFGTPAVSKMITELYCDGEFAACFKEAEKMVDPEAVKEMTRDKIELKKHESGIVKFDKDLLIRLLAHRIAFLRWAATKFPWRMKEIDVRDYYLELEDLKIKAKDKKGNVSADANYFRNIGFTCKNPDKKERTRRTENDDKEEMLKVDLDPKKLFEEEVLLFRDVSNAKRTIEVVDGSVNFWIDYILKDSYKQSKVLASVVPDVGKWLNEEFIRYTDLKEIFNLCDNIIHGVIPKTKKEIKAVENWMETVLSRDSFESVMLGSYYDSVIKILKQEKVI